MKRILILIAALWGVSCNMDQFPYSETADADYVTDDASVENLLIGAYNGLHAVLYYEWAMTELRSDNARMRVTGSTASETKLIEQLDQGVQQADHAWIEDYWNACYVAINRANSVLRNLDVVQNDELRAQYRGEAQFLRAMLYFNLVRLYGPVFIVTKKTGADEARRMQRSPVDEVYALIEVDLEAIVDEDLLPAQLPEAQTGRATLIAAKALLAKVYMTHYAVGEPKYMAAKTLLGEVLAAAGDPQSVGDLVPYDRIFAKDNEMNKEIIFAVRYLSGNVGLGSPFTSLFSPINNGGAVAIGTTKHFNYPSDNLLAAYNANAEGDKVDLRKAVVLAEGYINANGEEVTKDARFVMKYLDPDMSSAFDAENDWPVLRVGDVALLYAEIVNETEGPTAEALKYLNLIRERAGIHLYEASELASRYQFREAVRHERRLELAFENQRWFDLLRWGTAVSTYNEYLASEAFYTGYNYTVNPIAEWQTLLPIPISVININSDVAQNVGY